MQEYQEAPLESECFGKSIQIHGNIMAEPVVKLKRGRPSLYTPELDQEICQRLADGETLKGICRDDHVPDARTVRQWALDDLYGFSPRYAHARIHGVESLADELLEIADDDSNDEDSRTGKLDTEFFQRSRLRVDTRKWLLSKINPGQWGERLTSVHTGPEGSNDDA